MTPSRLSPLDTSFLRVETPTAHMHVGWVALFSPPKDRPAPTFAELRDAHRQPAVPRTALPAAPGGGPARRARADLGRRRSVRPFAATFATRARANINKVVEKVMSTPLDPADPLWQIWIADKLSDGRIGIVGKAHHCMVDGLAAVELAGCCSIRPASPRRPSRTTGSRQPAPTPMKMFATGLRDRVTEELDLLRVPAKLARQPQRVLEFAEDDAARGACADTFVQAEPGIAAEPADLAAPPPRPLERVRSTTSSRSRATSARRSTTWCSPHPPAGSAASSSAAARSRRGSRRWSR